MTLPPHFEKENAQNIFIYHYVEELIRNFQRYLDENFSDDEISRTEMPILIRIRFSNNTTQKEIVNLLNVSDGYTARILRKFEVNGFITREEDPTNRRKKIVKLTPKGIEKTDKLIKMLGDWEKNISQKISPEELETFKDIMFKLIT